jgi:hypothetical protein
MALIPECDLAGGISLSSNIYECQHGLELRDGTHREPWGEGETEFLLPLTSTARCQFRANVDSKTHLGHLTSTEMNVLIVMSR